MILIHQEDPEVDMVDVMEVYAGLPIVTVGMDGLTEIFDDDGCTCLDDDDPVSMRKHMS